MDHSPEEYLEVDSIVPRTTLVAALLLEMSRDPVVSEWRAAPTRA
jgi:acetylornithine deacetylase/succinyl-diaminopimelate desuccinylase-like protein